MKRFATGSAEAQRAIEIDPSALDGAQAAMTAAPSAWPELLARWQSLQDQLPQIVEQAVRRTLSDELALRPEHIRETVRELLARLDEPRQGLILRVHPEDVAHLEGALLDQVTVETDPEISPGGCVLCSPRARFDATLQTRLARVLAALHTPS